MRRRVRVCVDEFTDGVGVEGGVCVELWPGGYEVGEEPGGSGVDLRGLGSLGLPGAMDIHVHLRGLMLSYKEDEASGTAAAAAGCVTAVADMPNTRPELREPQALRAKLYALASASVVDYAVYAGIPRGRGAARLLALEGAAGFKVYPEDLRESPGMCEALRAAEEAGLVVVLHPELERLFSTPDWGYDRWLSRPCTAEAAAVAELESIMEACGARPRVHVTHASCPETVLEAKRRGFTVDVTPHHLFPVEASWMADSPCIHKVNPPVRGPLESARLQGLLLEGAVDALASDHAPHAPWEKAWSPPLCPPGMPWLEWWLGFAARRLLAALGPAGFARLVSTGPRSVVGAPGGLESGSLSVLLLEPERVSPPAYSRALYTPFHGSEYLPCLATIVGGRLVYLRGSGVIGVAGCGRRIAPQAGGDSSRGQVEGAGG